MVRISVLAIIILGLISDMISHAAISEKFSRITWSSKNIWYLTGIKLFEILELRGGHVTECASLCERSGIYNCTLFAVDHQHFQCYLLKFDFSGTWPDLGFTIAKVFARRGEMQN